MASEGEKRRRRAKNKRDREARKEAVIRAKFPAFRIDETGGSPPFVAAVKSLIDQFDFEDDHCCSRGIRNLCANFKKVGLLAMQDLAFKAVAQGHQGGLGSAYKQVVIEVITAIGDWLLKHLPERYTAKPLPYYYFNIEPREDALWIDFSFLPSAVMPEFRSPIFYSPLEPTVEMGGGTWKIVFLDHVLERACERISRYIPMRYRDFMACHLYFETCIYYEHVTLPDGQEALGLWENALSGPERTYVSHLLADEQFESQPEGAAYLVGYCPIKPIRGRAVGITLLFPGYHNTPEAALVNTRPIPRLLRNELRAAADDNTLAGLLKHEDFAVMRWYHENGSPQVKHVPQELFQRSPRIAALEERLGVLALSDLQT
jgi:hypothetical protein